MWPLFFYPFIFTTPAPYFWTIFIFDSCLAKATPATSDGATPRFSGRPRVLRVRGPGGQRRQVYRDGGSVRVWGTELHDHCQLGQWVSTWGDLCRSDVSYLFVVNQWFCWVEAAVVFSGIGDTVRNFHYFILSPSPKESLMIDSVSHPLSLVKLLLWCKFVIDVSKTSEHWHSH